jgi:hypothetical protein
MSHLTRRNYFVLGIWRILWMATARVIQAMRASQSKAQTPVMTVGTPDSESEYFDASEHSSYSDYFSDCGPEKMVGPIAEDIVDEAPDSDAEEGTPPHK